MNLLTDFPPAAALDTSDDGAAAAGGGWAMYDPLWIFLALLLLALLIMLILLLLWCCGWLTGSGIICSPCCQKCCPGCVVCMEWCCPCLPLSACCQCCGRSVDGIDDFTNVLVFTRSLSDLLDTGGFQTHKNLKFLKNIKSCS